MSYSVLQKSSLQIAPLPVEKKTAGSCSVFNIESLKSEDVITVKDNLNFFELIWIRKGSGTIRTAFNQYELRQHCLYCFMPGQKRQLETGANIDGYSITFTSAFLRQAPDDTELVFYSTFFDGLSFSAIIQLNDNQRDDMNNIAAKMKRAVENNTFLQAESLQGLLKLFFVNISRQCCAPIKPVTKTRSDEVAQSFLLLLEKDFAQKKQVADYASALFVSSNYLNQIVKKITGFPASYHIRQRIILEAKRKATQSNASMKEIADWLGFDDFGYFSKFFKNVAGVGFSEFRKRIHERRMPAPVNNDTNTGAIIFYRRRHVSVPGFS